MALSGRQHQPPRRGDIVFRKAASPNYIHVGEIILGVRIAEGGRRVLEEFARPLRIGVNVAVGNAGQAVDADGDSNTNWRNTARNAARLSRRKSAMVLKSGFKVRNSQMTSMLRRHSASSRRLDRTRFR